MPGRARFLPLLPLLVLPLAAACRHAPPRPEGGGVIRGQVLYADQEPVPGALILLEGGLEARSDARGRFELGGVREGRRAILAVAPGCLVAGGEIRLRAGEAHWVRLVVPSSGEGRWSLGPRAEGGALRVVTAPELRKMRPTSVADAVRRVVPEMVQEASAYAGGRQGVTGRGRNTATGSMTPLVVVDGVLLPGQPWETLASLDPMDVLRIEIVRGVAGGWAYGLAGVNGVIRIYTRAGAEKPGPRTPPEECGFRAPRGGGFFLAPAFR